MTTSQLFISFPAPCSKRPGCKCNHLIASVELPSLRYSPITENTRECGDVPRYKRTERCEALVRST